MFQIRYGIIKANLALKWGAKESYVDCILQCMYVDFRAKLKKLAPMHRKYSPRESKVFAKYYLAPGDSFLIVKLFVVDAASFMVNNVKFRMAREKQRGGLLESGGNQRF